MADEAGRLLVVDDNVENRDLLHRRLSRRGYRVETAEDGEGALQAVAEGGFDLVLLDILMPGMNGLEVLERIRRDHAAGDLPVVMVTALSESEDVVTALELGANDYITKPIDFPVVRARVETQLSLKRSRDALRDAHERTRRELEAASRVQRALLPDSLPELEGMRFAWRYEPCDELAGDLLNVIPFDEHRAAVYVLDVCGHGVRSSLLSVAMSHTLSRRADPTSIVTSSASDGEGYQPESPATVAGRLSALFPMEDNGMLFATLTYCVLDRRAGRFTYTCAGSPGPLRIRSEGDAIRHDEPGLPIGIRIDDESGDHAYRDHVLEIGPGDRLFLYSDGFLEEQGPSGEEFGQERVSETLAGTRDRSLDEGLDALVETLRAWVAPQRFRDDLSIVALEID
jgi:sigma-B regulation protein RsbU (phosphoserine phosphatase)